MMQGLEDFSQELKSFKKNSWVSGNFSGVSKKVIWGVRVSGLCYRGCLGGYLLPFIHFSLNNCLRISN